jgi:hypothetical protein
MERQERQRVANFEKNAVLRLTFLANEISEKEFKQVLQQRDLKSLKENEIRDIKTTFVTVATDLLNQLSLQNHVQQVGALQSLALYIEEQFKSIASRFNCQAQPFDFPSLRL